MKSHTALTLLATAVLAGVQVPTSAEAQRPRCGTRTTAPCTAPGLVFQSISAGNAHTCGVTLEGAAYCWGDGRRGALGDGALEISRQPRRVQGNDDFVEIGAGGDYSCARTVDNAVLCWGGERTVPGWPEVANRPVRVNLERPAAALSVGRRHACVLDAEGRASCWGWNVDGETGTGTSGVDRSMVPYPVAVATDQRFLKLSAGMGSTCGVTLEGAVLCWGSNVDQVLGQSAPERCGEVATVPCSSHPVEIRMPERMKHVSVGSSHACALAASGTVYCWGANGSGQVGAFGPGVPVVHAPSAVRVPRSGPFVTVTSGGIHTCALTAARRVYCWGADDINYGDDQSRAEELAPRLAAAGTQFQAISAGQLHACGLDLRGRALCWGDTVFGALGGR